MPMYSSDIEVITNSNGYEKGILIVGQTTIGAEMLTEYTCNDPNEGVIPICDSNDNYYTEFDELGGGTRMYLMYFDLNEKLQWSTVFGSDYYNYFKDVSTSNGFVYAVGFGLYNTILEFDENSTLDYIDELAFTSLTGTVDGTIAMFGINDMVTNVIESETTINNYIIYPNPFSDLINISLKKHEDIRIELHSIDGKLLKEYIIPFETSEIAFETGQITPGVYLVTVVGETYKTSEVIIKQ